MWKLKAAETLLEQATQRNGETTSAYKHRFKAEAQCAYIGDRAPSEEYREVSSFLQGFTDWSFAEWVFFKGKTATLNEVTKVPAALEAQEEKLDQALKSTGPEAMGLMPLVNNDIVLIFG